MIHTGDMTSACRWVLGPGLGRNLHLSGLRISECYKVCQQEKELSLQDKNHSQNLQY